ncbi:hypothetical protein LOK49_LG07G01744 [Camellia lanceoleosa]|uniref:Uncharacterized protein n=1 Tax=Camellia lanceoleosa TaxID=1840588 RepID=A0ACC0H1L7_9ERIC|nr:hypothetical protein LOK49_LG07G01744 [Camellia lanceoleosa]
MGLKRGVLSDERSFQLSDESDERSIPLTTKAAVCCDVALVVPYSAVVRFDLKEMFVVLIRKSTFRIWKAESVRGERVWDVYVGRFCVNVGVGNGVILRQSPRKKSAAVGRDVADSDFTSEPKIVKKQGKLPVKVKSKNVHAMKKMVVDTARLAYRSNINGVIKTVLEMKLREGLKQDRTAMFEEHGVWPGRCYAL